MARRSARAQCPGLAHRQELAGRGDRQELGPRHLVQELRLHRLLQLPHHAGGPWRPVVPRRGDQPVVGVQQAEVAAPAVDPDAADVRHLLHRGSDAPHRLRVQAVEVPREVAGRPEGTVGEPVDLAHRQPLAVEDAGQHATALGAEIDREIARHADRLGADVDPAEAVHRAARSRLAAESAAHREAELAAVAGRHRRRQGERCRRGPAATWWAIGEAEAGAGDVASGRARSARRRGPARRRGCPGRGR